MEFVLGADICYYEAVSLFYVENKPQKKQKNYDIHESTKTESVDKSGRRSYDVMHLRGTLIENNFEVGTGIASHKAYS